MDRKYTMEYYSGIKKNEILPFAAIGMDLEGIMLRETNVRQRKTNTIWSHLYVEFFKKWVHEYRE